MTELSPEVKREQQQRLQDLLDGMVEPKMRIPFSEEAYKKVVDDLEKRFKHLETERDNWRETARQHLNNEDFLRGLLMGVGSKFGLKAYISDDGTIQQDILLLNVPELVTELFQEITILKGKLRERESSERVASST